MTDKKAQPKKLSTSHTKQEMLDAYNELLKQLQEKPEAELKPEEEIAEKSRKLAVAMADSLSTEGIVQGISGLKTELGKLLSRLADCSEEEVNKYRQIKLAVEVKEKELQEIYEIQKTASSLTALIEVQQRQRQAFEAEMAARREELQREIENLRAEWEKEKKQHEVAIQGRDAAERIRQEREQDEYLYKFQREQQLAQDRFQDEKAQLEREIQYKREQLEREVAERERALAQREGELNELRQKASIFPQELEAAVHQAVREAVARVQGEAKSKEDLLKKELEGERNMLQARIDSLERTAKEQEAQIAKLSQQLEKAYAQVQEIALKALESSGSLKSLAGLQPWGGGTDAQARTRKVVGQRR